MGGSAKKLTRGADSFDALKRRYCRRYALPPTVAVSRRELIADAVFAEAEADGRLPYDRVEALLTAIFYALGRLAERRGVDMREVARQVADVGAIRPRKEPKASLEEIERREEEETRRAFAPILERAKRALRREERERKEENDERPRADDSARPMARAA